MSANPAFFKKIEAELPAIYERVAARAIQIVSRKRWSRPGIMPEGQEAEDLVQEALRRLLDDSRAWDPEKVSLEDFLVGSVRSIASSAVKGLANRVRAIENDGAREIRETRDANFQSPSPEQQLEELQRYKLLAEAVLNAVSGDHDVEVIVAAVLEGCVKRAELIKETGLDSRQFDNAIKRLHRRLDDVAAKLKVAS
ncbi:sigma-70 family RNA polymerase sigma factor [Myxococcus sp. AB056]|uniref:sigma-70 family RNA polymerase sigma factor n=1 Tax=Myxococcus sp. AB056 TaxID=2562792 RepID=UPI001890C496|nr:sigma-70 family RNA polymerase sigma factor [Myxococcus sp. AB056]